MAASKVFISYSRKDDKFAAKIEKRLEAEGLEVVRDVHSLNAGRTQKQLEAAIAKVDALLLIFSENSAGSDWVEWEVDLSRQREKAEKIDLMCPISLDDAWRDADWSGPLMLQIRDYNILDFSNPRKFNEAFDKLAKGLRDWY